MHTVCTSSANSARAAAAEGNFLKWTTDIEEMIADPEVDIIDISLPNNLHRPVVTKALLAGKAVYCEKPLSGTLEDALSMEIAVKRAAPCSAWFSSTAFFPQSSKPGKFWRISAWEEFSHGGRIPALGVSKSPSAHVLENAKEDGGSGALGDLGSHVIDLVCCLLGEFDSVQGQMETFIKERPIAGNSSELGSVTVDDVVWFRTRMENGSIGTVEASRFATGTMDDLRIQIYGEKGALKFNLMDPGFLYYFDEAKPSGSYGGERAGRDWKQRNTIPAPRPRRHVPQ